VENATLDKVTLLGIGKATQLRLGLSKLALGNVETVIIVSFMRTVQS
jgi:hypothetical protein